MVGVPGRSKGCITCKQRGVKCDEKRPFCDRCRRLWVPCAGYAQERIFIDQSTRLRQASRSGESSATGNGRKGAVGASSQTSASSGDAREITAVEIMALQRTSPRTYRPDIYISFLMRRLFSGRYRDGSANTWILAAIEEDGTSLVYNAACGLATALFEKTHLLESTSPTHGAAQYGKALRLLNHAIRDGRLRYGSATVVATLLLSLYEMIVFTSRHGWIQHAGGIEKLIEMRGVDRHRREPERHYFIMSRMPIITRALALQRHTFLEQEGWKSIPWAAEPESKIPLHYVQDIFADVPGLIEDSNVLKKAQAALPGDGEHPTTSVKDYCQRLTETLRKLFLWRWEWERANPASVSEAAVAEPFPNLPGPPETQLLSDETMFHYSSFQAAREIMLYNTVLLWVLGLATAWIGPHAVHDALSPFTAADGPPPLNPLTLPSDDLSALQVCGEIRRSAEYHLQEPHSHSGAMFLMLPLRAVLTLGPGEEERAWAGQVLRRAADIHGFGISRGLQDRIAVAAGLPTSAGPGTREEAQQQ